MYFGKGLVSKKQYDAAYAACDFSKRISGACRTQIEAAFQSIGPHNVYFLYDTCSLDDLSAWLEKTSVSARSTIFPGFVGSTSGR